jgi:hypothetical protein
MPISYTIDKAQCQLHTTITGHVTVEEILGHLEAARKEQTFPYAELVDMRGVAFPLPSAADIRRVTTFMRGIRVQEAFGPCALIVSDDASFGMARMFSTLLSGLVPVNVFRNQEEAERWLAGQSSSPADATK